MSKFVLEFFSEELPATLQKKIVSDYKVFTENELKKNDAKNINNLCFCITLNRLIVYSENFDINIQQLKDFIFLTLKEFSKTFQRTMNYPQLDVRWIRPIRSIFACVDDNVIIDNFYGILSKNGIYVNKFDYNECNDYERYFDILNNEKIIINYDERLEFVKQNIYKYEKSVFKSLGENIVDFDDYWNGIGKRKYLKLAEEIAGMSEYCIEPINCVLDERFNILPFELIELVLRENQRYVVLSKNDKHEIQFLIFGDRITREDKHRENVKNGHKKVVNARLEDALYYWNLDFDKFHSFNDKGSINNLKDILSKRIFIENLSWRDYLQRQEKLAEEIVFDNKILERVKRLIWETKLDLATNVVSEFPELQGVIGEYYFGYNFNPYVMENIQNSDIDDCAMYYYLIDRCAYILTMFECGKQPTGSGDKYKVKARMDDVVKIFDKKKDIASLKEIFNKESVRDLFIKRYVKYIEDLYKNKDNIKQIAEKYVNYIMSDDIKYNIQHEGNVKRYIMVYSDTNKIVDIDIDCILKYIDNNEFIKAYKRIIGYTKSILDSNKTDSAEMNSKVSEICKNETKIINEDSFFKNINTYLDEHLIVNDKNIVSALKIIQDKYFVTKLPLVFLEIV